MKGRQGIAAVSPLLRARLRHAVLRCGLPGWIGAGALLAAVAVVAQARWQAAEQIDRTAREIAELNLRLQRLQGQGAVPARAAADPSAAVSAQLPAADTAPGFIQAVQDDAQHAGVQIDRAEYKVQAALGRRVVRLQMAMPAHGTYPQLRGWIQSLLYEHPGAALDELSLRRESDGSAQLEARIGLSYYSQAVR